MIKNSTRLFIAIFCAICFSSSAQNLLTNRQIYNFNVGDEFEYQQTILDGSGNQVSDNHLFNTILSKRLSTGNDTVFYTIKQRSYNRPDSANVYDTTVTVNMSYTKLDTVGLVQAYVHTSKDSFSWTIDTFNGRVENKFFQISPNLPHAEYLRIRNSWAQGLGEILSNQMSDGNSGTSTQLVYFKKKNEVYGVSFFAGIENDMNQSIGVSIYPNPAKTGDPLTIVSKTAGLKTLRIIDMTGKIVYSCIGRESLIRIPDMNLSPAVYSLLINDGNQILIQKIVVIQ